MTEPTMVSRAEKRAARAAFIRCIRAMGRSQLTDLLVALCIDRMEAVRALRGVSRGRRSRQSPEVIAMRDVTGRLNAVSHELARRAEEASEWEGWEVIEPNSKDEKFRTWSREVHGSALIKGFTVWGDGVLWIHTGTRKVRENHGTPEAARKAAESRMTGDARWLDEIRAEQPWLGWRRFDFPDGECFWERSLMPRGLPEDDRGSISGFTVWADGELWTHVGDRRHDATPFPASDEARNHAEKTAKVLHRPWIPTVRLGQHERAKNGRKGGS